MFQATGTGHAQRTAQRICREDVLPNKVIGKWSRWEQRGRIYGCSFLNSHLNRQTHRLLITEIATNGIPEDTVGNDHPLRETLTNHHVSTAGRVHKALERMDKDEIPF